MAVAARPLPPPVAVRCYGELNDFLDPRERQQTVSWPIELPTTVRDVLEAVGVPHTEAEVVLVDGGPVDLDARLLGGERLVAYPAMGFLDVPWSERTAPPPPRPTRFAVDVHLGRLARHLRLVGFDTWYRNDADDPRLATLAASGRVLLTRDRGLLKRSEVRWGRFVRAHDPGEQTAEVLARFELFDEVAPYTRCLACNGLLERRPVAALADRVPDDVAARGEKLSRCPDCGRVYWRGSHTEHLDRVVRRILAGAPHPEVR